MTGPPLATQRPLAHRRHRHTLVRLMPHRLLVTTLLLALFSVGAQADTPARSVESYHVKTLDRHTGYRYRPARRAASRDERLGIRVIDVAGKTPLVRVLGHGHDTHRATIAVDVVCTIPMSKRTCLRSAAPVNTRKISTRTVVMGFEWHREDPARVRIELQSLSVALNHLSQLRADSNRVVS
ncbi:MAG: hypothetical protein AAGA11_19270 [Pseudomonadota bacterium]